jgi:hypothetical protein
MRMAISEVRGLKGLSVLQYLYEGRTGRTKCGMYLFASSLTAAVLGTRRIRRARAGRVRRPAFLSILSSSQKEGRMLRLD